VDILGVKGLRVFYVYSEGCGCTWDQRVESVLCVLYKFAHSDYSLWFWFFLCIWSSTLHW